LAAGFAFLAGLSSTNGVAASIALALDRRDRATSLVFAFTQTPVERQAEEAREFERMGLLPRAEVRTLGDEGSWSTFVQHEAGLPDLWRGPWARNVSERTAPFHFGSFAGKKSPMSLSPHAPSIELGDGVQQHVAVAVAPQRPSERRFDLETADISGRPRTRRWTSNPMPTRVAWIMSSPCADDRACREACLGGDEIHPRFRDLEVPRVRRGRPRTAWPRRTRAVAQSSCTSQPFASAAAVKRFGTSRAGSTAASAPAQKIASVRESRRMRPSFTTLDRVPHRSGGGPPLR